MNLVQTIDFCRKEGGLTLSDLARWLQVPVPTLRSWAEESRTPSDSNAYIYGRLEKLKELVASAGGNLVPHTVRLGKRAAFINGLRDEHFRISRESSAA